MANRGFAPKISNLQSPLSSTQQKSAIPSAIGYVRVYAYLEQLRFGSARQVASLCQLVVGLFDKYMGHRTWDIPTFDIVRARSSFPKMSNVGMSHVRSQMHLSNNQITH